MDLQRIEHLGLHVEDLEGAIQRFSDLFGIEFEICELPGDFDVKATRHGADSIALRPGMRVALDSSGLFELIEAPDVAEGFRNIHLRVRDMDEAVAKMTAQGMRLVRESTTGRMRESIFDGKDLYNIRVCLVQYDGPSIVAAMKGNGPAT